MARPATRLGEIYDVPVDRLHFDAGRYFFDIDGADVLVNDDFSLSQAGAIRVVRDADGRTYVADWPGQRELQRARDRGAESIPCVYVKPQHAKTDFEAAVALSQSAPGDEELRAEAVRALRAMFPITVYSRPVDDGY